MAGTPSFYPNLGTIVKADQLPEELQFIQNGLQNLLDKLYYKHLQYTTSQDGSQAYYSIVLVSATELKIDLFGSGFALVINPGITGETLIPISLNYNWPILGIIKNFDLASFSFLPQQMQDILNQTTSLSDTGLVETGVESFEGNTDLNAFKGLADKINQLYNLSGLNRINHPSDGSTTAMADDIRLQIEANPGITDAVNTVVNKVYVQNTNNDIFKQKLDTFSKAINGFSIEDYIRSIIIPRIDASLGLSIGLSFPRNVLLPLTAPVASGGTPLPEPEQAVLVFDIGKLLFSTQGGISFDKELSASLNYPCQIGKTGLGLELEKAKLDLSRRKNIPEADLDGRPSDFMGVYFKKVAITLPSRWFKDVDNTTAKISGYNILAGTGGLSGTITLEAIGGDNTLWAKVGDFRVGFSSFDITFKQNKVLSSNIEGALEIKKFVYPGTNDPVEIKIKGHLHDNGDFNLTASAEPPYPIELKEVFTYELRSVELGRQDNDFYIGTAGTIQFEGFLKETLGLGPIEVERLRIYSDGSIEFQGGSINLIKPMVLRLGPVEITVSAIHYGSHQKEVDGVMRKFNYFGFDGGISVDPLGIEIRGDGVKYYYCSDNLPNKPRAYLHIQTLYLDLTIPANTPVAIINGWLSIPEPGTSKEYAGGIKLQLPKAKIAGSADMKLMPRYPAFIIDAEIEFPAPIPLGPVGIYGFRGLIGYRYVAEKEAAGLVSGVDTWYDYYKAPQRGINVRKFNGPDKTKFAGTPFSIGAGASLGTSFDNGTVLNIKAMILLSIPSLFMIDGRAAILSARLGLDSTTDPPFFAFIAIGDNSLELGVGADFKMPSSSGAIMSLYADIQAGFFFKNQRPWYVNIGTKTNPITARVLTLLTLKSYLMLSAKGIEAGARGEFNFERKYGIIKVRAWAYIEIGGFISFERPQFGAYLAAGVGAEVNIKIVDLFVSIDILFGVEAPRPFLIYGKFRLCVRIKIMWVFSFKFCGELEIMWEFNKQVDRTPINPMINPAGESNIPKLVKGVNMLSNEIFELAFAPGNTPPTNLPDSFKKCIIPIDTYIDIKSEKGFLPSAVGNLIGGINNPPEKYTELIPPEKVVRGKVVRQVKHQYSIERLAIRAWNGSTWVDYHPYEALYPTDGNILSMKAGQFQKSDGQYNTIRILGTTPFSYTEEGQPGWFVPEQNGLTAATLFCESQKRDSRCANFLTKPLNQRYYCYDENYPFYSNDASFYLMNKTDDEYAEITDRNNPHQFRQSVEFNNNNKLQILLPKPSVEVKLRLSSYAYGVRIKYYTALIDDNALEPVYGNPDPNAANPNAPYEVYKSAAELQTQVIYNRPDWRPVVKIIVEPVGCETTGIGSYQGSNPIGGRIL
jgi:hypothetical protein